MFIVEKINEIIVFCKKHGLELIIQSEGEKNYITIELSKEKKIIINITDFEDKDIEELIEKKIKELNELFK